MVEFLDCMRQRLINQQIGQGSSAACGDKPVARGDYVQKSASNGGTATNSACGLSVSMDTYQGGPGCQSAHLTLGNACRRAAFIRPSRRLKYDAACPPVKSWRDKVKASTPPQ
jgi:hypothetical protein